MPILAMKDLLAHAEQKSYAVGYFEAWNLESLQAVIDAAEEERSPVIIGFCGDHLFGDSRLDRVALEYYAALGRTAAETATVPVALLLNETSSVPIIMRAIKLGFTGVMLDNPGVSAGEKAAMLKEVVKVAHDVGVSVEASCGELASSLDGTGESLRQGWLTDPQEAARFVDETEVDALAVSVGNVHTLVKGRAGLDLDLLARIRRATDCPLVLHGGTGLAYDDLRGAIQLGVRKVNVGSVLKRLFLKGIKTALDGASGFVDPHALFGSGGSRDLMTAGKLRMKDKVIEFMRVCGSTGKA